MLATRTLYHAMLHAKAVTTAEVIKRRFKGRLLSKNGFASR